MRAVVGALAAGGSVVAVALALGARLGSGTVRPLRPAEPLAHERTGGGGTAPAISPGSRAPDVAARPPPVPLIAAVVVLVLLVAAVVGPVVAVVGVAFVGLARVRAARSALRRRRRAVEVAVPDLVDLFVIAAAAGHPVQACVVMVADRAPEPLRPALSAARSSLAHGMSLADALAGLGAELGVLGPSLTGALAASAATGAPLGPALHDVASIARDRRRREAENEARRLPVTLLFPLVCCVLPAFVLLAVVPLLAASLAALEI
ncbi:MAG: hypothetical protein GX643_08735 [Acidimicrobiales bacterium]|nr:hypothetical protein [Acidimicrobiales bacterium]